MLKTKLSVIVIAGCCWIGFLGLATVGRAQNVAVSGALVGNGSYVTLGAAFAAINAGGQGGANIVVTIVGNTNEGAGTAVLNQSTAPWATLLIQPSGGARTVTGLVNAAPLIDLNGADNVTIDGLNVSGNSLTLQNTSVAATAGTSTIRLQGDATNNLITRCEIQGSSTMSNATNGGTVWFGNGLSTGNDNNTFSFCNIGPAGTNIPAKAIYSGGSTTTSNLYNSGNQILNCNVFDFFHATAASHGIFLGVGNTGWTIGNNKWYQTAPRTQTSGTMHSCIRIANAAGNDGHTISGNTIGYSSAAGTGMYSFTGTAFSYFYPIYVQPTSTTLTNLITGNTVSGLAVSGALSGQAGPSPFNAIRIETGLANTLGNTVGSLTTNNAITFTSSSTAACDVIAIYHTSSNSTTINNNMIGGITVGSSSTGAIKFYGIRVLISSTVPSTLQGNQIGGALANSILNTATGSNISAALGIQIDLSAATITGNTIRNMTVAAGTGSGPAPSVGGIVFNDASSTGNVTGNTISDLQNTNPSGTRYVVGIAFAGNSGANSVAKNSVHTLVGQSPFANLVGIWAITGNTTYSNNLIRLGYDGAGASISNGTPIYGFAEFNLGPNQFYHNSVYIGGTGVTGISNSYAMASSIMSGTRNYVNNIFYNARSNSTGTGNHFAIWHGGTTPNPTGLTSNYNDLFATGNGGAIGNFNFIPRTTLTDWQQATGQDLNSFSSDPMFINPTGNSATGDLHISAAPTPIEGSGLLIPAITDDCDGQSRGGLSPTDVGADAGNFVFLDIFPPSISYTPLGMVCNTNDRTVTATITDFSGVPISGLLQPRIYFRKNAGVWFSTQGVLSSGLATNGTWTFSISSAAMGGITSYDVISYYVVAQDIATLPNISSMPQVGLVAANVNSVTTPPYTPNVYSIFTNLNGTYTVGVGGNFTTLTAAVYAYNNACLGGPVLFSLIDNNYPSETFPITIRANVMSSAINTLTIKPTLAGTTIQGSDSICMIRMSGADYVTLDGSVGNTVNAICPLSVATRDLTITNNFVNNPLGGVWLGTTTGGDPVTNCTVKNTVIVKGASSVYGDVGLGTGGDGVSSVSRGNGNNNIAFINNDIRSFLRGIYASGFLATNKNQGLTINQNLVNVTTPNTIAIYGINVMFTNNFSVSGNQVANLNSSSGLDVCGINIGYPLVNGFQFPLTGTADCNSNASITHNKVSAIAGIYSFSTVGIGLGNTVSGTTLIANNVIDGIIGSPTPNHYTAGISLGGGTGTVNVHHNSVWLHGNVPAVQTNITVSACLMMTGAACATNIHVRNNIFYNSQSCPPGSSLRSVCIGYGCNGPYTPGTSDYNDLYSGGLSPGNYHIGATWLTTTVVPVTTLANWQTITGGDANSVNILPVFASNTDLHLPFALNTGLNNLGQALPTVTNDIDCETRSLTTTDMGADEMNQNCTLAEGGTVASSVTICTAGAVTLTATGYSIGNGTTYNWQSAPAGTNNWTNTGGVNPATYTSGTILVSTDLRLRVTCGTNASVDTSNVVTVTIGDITPPTALCQTVTVNLNGLGMGTTTAAVVNNASTDNCTAGPALQLSLSNSNFNCSNLGNNAVVLTVTDGAGNTATCSGSVVVIDPILPTITCPANIGVNNGLGACSAVVSYTPPVGTDNCAAPTTIRTAGLSSNATFPVGITVNVFRVTDASGNSATCSFIVIVTDNTPPTAICQSVTVQLDPNGNGSTNAIAVNNGSTDNCTVASTTLSQTAFTCANAGANTVTLTVTDGSGNTGTCNATVTVVAPLLTLSAVPATAQCGYNISCAGAADGTAMASGSGGCPTYSYVWSNGQASATATGLGAGTYSVTVTDGAGGTAVQTVTLTAPAALAATATATPSCTGDSSGSIDLTVTGGNDCAGYTFAWSNGAVSEDLSGLAAGNYSVTVTDIAGCSATNNIAVAAWPLPQPSFSQAGNLLSATQTWSSYQWLFNGGAISGANGNTYLITQTGTYALSVTDGNGCVGLSDTSMITGISVPMSDLHLLVFPNPARGTTFVQLLGSDLTHCDLRICDLRGRLLVQCLDMDLSERLELDLRDFAAGTYLVETMQGGLRRTVRLLVQ